MKHLLSALGIVFMLCISAKGEEVTFSFRGTVHELDGEYSFFTGQPFEITYSFERSSDDADPDDPESGSYTGAIKSGTLTIFTGNESFIWAVEPDGLHNVIGVQNLATADSYSAGASVSGPASGRKIPAHFIVELTDSDAAALSNDTLPLSLESGSFDHRIVKFTFIGVSQSVYSTWGTITSCAAPVPHSDTGRRPGAGSPEK